jgi:hypothetical protein
MWLDRDRNALSLSSGAAVLGKKPIGRDMQQQKCCTLLVQGVEQKISSGSLVNLNLA